ncbi:MAG: 3-hydroxyacyl-CoA dehydrogenase NAD-binding domain-containing protein, partial [Burkholderiales bacterium]
MRVAALGAGRMGRGIGHVFAYAGYRVDVIDFKARAPEEGARLREAAFTEIGANLALLRELGVLDEAQRRAILGRIRILPLEEA